MLPFLKNTKEGGISTPPDKIKRESDEGSDLDLLETCSQDLISAIHSKDAKGVKEALKAFFEICDSEPHEEGEHI